MAATSDLNVLAKLNGDSTPMADTTDLTFQADPRFPPDKAEGWSTPMNEDGWVHAHNALRFEIASLKRALAAVGDEPLVTWQVHAFQAWWEGHAAHVHEHHSNEDDVMNPFLRERIRLPDKLEADHVELVATMKRIGAEVSGLGVGATTTALRGLWTEYETLMLPHLFEEEQVGLPLARAYFTQQEVGKVVESFLKDADPRSTGAFVHALGSKKHALRFMKQNGIPSFVWHIPGQGFKAMRTLYRKKMVSHIDSLVAGRVVCSKHSSKATKKGRKPTQAAYVDDENARPNVDTVGMAN